MKDLIGSKLAIIGGDQREFHLITELEERGFALNIWGFDRQATPGRHFDSPGEAVQDVQGVILPLAGVNEDLTVPCLASTRSFRVDRAFFESLPSVTPVIIGWVPTKLKDLTQGLLIIEAAKDEELAVLNSIPTAEGAIAIAMAEAPVTLHGNEAMVLGFGRCGVALATMLGNIGARVSVVAKVPADRARAAVMGFSAYSFTELEKVLPKMAFIFNTVPAPVLTEPMLARIRHCYVIIDIASGGGTDFTAAADLGLKAILAPGLPGKVAPVTAGMILARVYPRLITESRARGERN